MDKKSIDNLLTAILSLQSKKEAQQFFRDLLTEQEIQEFCNRWEVAQMLYKKESYITISKKTGMSSTTIARISQWLRKGRGGYQLVLKRLINTKNEER